MIGALLRRFGWAPAADQRSAAPTRVRGLGYAGAQLTRFVDFGVQLEAAHKERQRDIHRLRAHSRDLAKNNVYMRRFLEMVSTNVVGPEGVTFESEILGNQDRPKKDWNDAIEESYAEWGSACTTDGLLSWLELQHLTAETVAQDGECLIRLIRGYGNKWGFGLELIDADRLDHTYNTVLPGGDRVIMGVEVNPWGKPLAYHIWSSHPQDPDGRPVRQRVPADQIRHIFTQDRARATRGIPWATPVMVQLNMLGRLWTSELAAANAESDRLGLIKTSQGVNLDDVNADPVEVAAELQSEHAHFLGLDPGLDVVFPNIQHPNSALPQFTAYLLKGIAAGFGVAYHSLAGDVSDSNYSSSRVALLDERDFWRKRQQWLIKNLHEPIFRAWLEMALLSGAIKIPALDFERACKPRWQPRTWDWVDPEKDANAALLSIAGGLSTHQKELGSRGLDWRETFDQLKQEQAYAKEIGLDLVIGKGAPMATAPAQASGQGKPAPKADSSASTTEKGGAQ